MQGRADMRLGYRHPQVQRLRLLISRREERDTNGVFVVEGFKLIEAGLNAGLVPEAVFVAPETDATMVAPIGARVVALETGVIQRVSDTVTPQGVIAVFPQHLKSLKDTSAPFVVLVDVRDPGNAGTMLRSAEASGIATVIFTQGSVDVYNPKVVRASAGAIFNVDVVRDVVVDDLIDSLAKRGIVTIGTDMNAAATYDQTDFTRDLALLMGNEANGLDADVASRLDEMVSIPMAGRSESLNVSMAASVLCFELARQKRLAS